MNQQIKKDNQKFYQTLEQRILFAYDKISTKVLEKKVKELYREYALLLEKYFMSSITKKYFESRTKDMIENDFIIELLNKSVNIKSQIVLLERKYSMFL